MKKIVFVFSENNGNTGEEKLFDSKEKAVDYADGMWNHLTEREKRVYDTSEAWYRVYEVELTPEQLEEYEDCGSVDDKPLTEYETRTIIEK